jgi:flagellar biosynthesis/type III secretory pathway M-ring protein FliF/YscJ
MVSFKRLFQFLVVFFICAALRGKSRKASKQQQQQQQQREEEQNFHEVDAFGDDFIDFGAQTGERGQFSWHADFPLE